MNASDLPDERLFEEALNCRTPADLATLLDKACVGQPELRCRLETLLEAHRHSGDFLEPPGEAQFTRKLEPVSEEPPGTLIGRYKLLQKIGEGGMGLVYMAEQTRPVVRKVALKIIKLGMDTRQVVARFEAERQALALMDHSNIAKVLDAGATDTGRPYFVMELVHGVPITEYCDRNKLSTKGRLELFIPVCQAVQHAHQKGIIHRDLKPSNVMVTLHDGLPVPKVIDFGVAKATNQRLTEKTLFTHYAQIIGTPAYMSPEQAEMSGLDIDTRSDIYSLGVLLYELLTGSTPFDAKELLSKGYAEMQRIIVEQEPAKPSTRMSTLSDEQRTVVATNRSMEAGALRRVLQGDLDWIVMKCLEKDRTRRYETSNGLAMDIMRYLRDEPLAARPPSAAYRFHKWLRRHKLGFAIASTGVTIALASFLALAIANFQINSARRSEHQERSRAIDANQRLSETNTRLVDSLELLKLQHVENLFESGDASTAIANLTALLRQASSNQTAASRLVSALVHRNLALPILPPLHHQDGVSSARFSPDGTRLLTASRDGLARLWDLDTGRPTGREMKHRSAVVDAQFSPDGKVVATASEDGAAVLWDASTGERLAGPLTHDGPVTAIAFNRSGSQFVSGSEDRFAQVWGLPGGALAQRLGKHDSAVTAVVFSPDGTLVAAGTAQGGVTIWSVATGTQMTRMQGHTDYITAAHFSPDGSRLLTASRDGSARLWNAQDGQPVMEALQHEDWVPAAVFSPDGGLIATACQNGIVRLWRSDNGHAVGSPLRHEGSVRFLSFSPEGRRLATASLDLTARIWDVDTSREFCQPLWHGEWVSQAQYSPDGSRLATASFDFTVRLWDIQARCYQPQTFAHDDRLWAIDVSPDGKTLATASADQTARLWDLITGQLLAEPMRHESAVTAVAFSADSRWVASGDSHQVHIWDARTGKPRLRSPPVLRGMLRGVRFSPDGTRFVTGSADGVARVWDAVTGQSLTPPLVHSSEVWCVEFSPDGRSVATASLDNTARVWDAQTGKPLTDPLPHLDHVKHVAFSPDGRRLLTASTDNCARIWDTRTGRLCTEPMRHTRIVERARFSPDGKQVVTASIDRTARLWDSATGHALTPPMRHPDFVSDARFSSDGQRIVTACLNGAVRLWDAKTGGPLTEPLCRAPHSTVNLVLFTPDDRQVLAMSNGSALVAAWDVPIPPVPVPNWFVELTEQIIGIRLSTHGSVEVVANPAIPELRAQVDSVPETGFYKDLACWLLSPPTLRPTSPFVGIGASEDLAE